MKEMEKNLISSLREIELLKQKNRDDTEREKKTREKMTKEKDFVLLKYREVKQRNAQTQLKLIQTEKSMDQMKEKLQKITNDKTQIKAPLVINQSFKKTIDTQDLISQKVIKNLQDEKTTLQLENFELRKSIKEMNIQFDQLREKLSIGKEEKFQRFLSGELDLPFLEVKDEIKQKFKERMEDIENELKNRLINVKLEDPNMLEQKVKNQEKIIQDQVKMILHLTHEMNINKKELKTPLKRRDENQTKIEKSPTLFSTTPIKSEKSKENKI